MRWFKFKYTRYYSKGIHCKKVIYLQKSDLKTSWFSLQTDVRTRIVHFLKNSTHQPSSVTIHWIAYIWRQVPPSPIWFSKRISIISSSVALALLRSLWAQIIGGQNFFFFNLQLKPNSCARFSHHCQTVSHTALREVGQVPAPRCGSVDEELLGW